MKESESLTWHKQESHIAGSHTVQCDPTVTLTEKICFFAWLHKLLVNFKKTKHRAQRNITQWAKQAAPGPKDLQQVKSVHTRLHKQIHTAVFREQKAHIMRKEDEDGSTLTPWLLNVSFNCNFHFYLESGDNNKIWIWKWKDSKNK